MGQKTMKRQESRKRIEQNWKMFEKLTEENQQTAGYAGHTYTGGGTTKC